MRRALRRAGWALAAAGGIGIAAPAVAQSPAVRILGPGGQAAQADEVVVMTESQARLEEAQVELAFLADPMLFSYGLGARAEGGNLEVRGYVPSEAVRDQALRVAREHTALRVADKLRTQANVTTHGAVDRPENILRSARALLEDAFPEFGKHIEVKCDACGHVTVSGSVGSCEDMVAVSRKMRQVPGCSCVINQLSVAGAVPESRPAETGGAVASPDVPPVTTRPAVRKVEPSALPVSAIPVATPVKKESEPPSLGMPRVHVAPEVRPLPAPPPPIDLPPPAVKPEPRKPAPVLSIDKDRPYETQPPQLPPVPEVKPLPPSAVKPEPRRPAPVPSIDKDHPYGTESPHLPPVPSVKPLPAPPPPPNRWVPPAPPIDLPPAPAVKPEPRKPAPVLSIDKDRPYGSGSAGTTSSDLPPATPVKPLPAVKLPEVVNEPARPVSPPPVIPPQSRAPAPMQQPKIITPTQQPKVVVADQHHRGGSEESYVTEGTITFADDPPPPPKPVGRIVKPLSAPVKPAEGTLTLTPPPMPPSRPASAPVVLAVPPARLPAAPAPPPPPRLTVPPAVRLKERIEGICGPAYEVKVTARGKNSLLLDVIGRDEADGQRVMRRITPVLQSTEFSAFEITVDVVTGRK